MSDYIFPLRTFRSANYLGGAPSSSCGQVHTLTHFQEYAHLLVVLDPHAQSIDQNGDHNPSSEVLAVHDLPERVTHQPPEADNVGRRFAQPEALLLGLPAVSPVPVVEVLCELVHAIAVGVSGGLVAIGGPFCAVGATLKVQCQCCCVHGAAGSAEVASRQLARELGCSRVRKVRWRKWDGEKETAMKSAWLWYISLMKWFRQIVKSDERDRLWTIAFSRHSRVCQRQCVWWWWTVCAVWVMPCLCRLRCGLSGCLPTLLSSVQPERTWPDFYRVRRL